MLTDRIIGAFTFRREVYAEVEQDPTFTQTAWILVVAIGFLNQLGSNASTNLLNWLIGTAVGTIFAVISFAVAAFVINWAGRTLFQADVTFEELVRTLGLAYVWNIVGVVGVLAAFIGPLACLLAPALIVGVILMIVAWFVAVKEALDLEWGQTIVTVILGWIALMVIMAVAGMVMTLMGVTAAGVGNLLGS